MRSTRSAITLWTRGCSFFYTGICPPPALFMMSKRHCSGESASIALGKPFRSCTSSSLASGTRSVYLLRSCPSLFECGAPTCYICPFVNDYNGGGTLRALQERQQYWCWQQHRRWQQHRSGGCEGARTNLGDPLRLAAVDGICCRTLRKRYCDTLGGGVVPSTRLSLWTMAALRV